MYKTLSLHTEKSTSDSRQRNRNLKDSKKDSKYNQQKITEKIANTIRLQSNLNQSEVDLSQCSEKIFQFVQKLTIYICTNR